MCHRGNIPLLVMSVKKSQYPCSGLSMAQQIMKMCFEFPCNLTGKMTMAFYQVNRGTYSTPCTQISVLFCRQT